MLEQEKVDINVTYLSMTRDRSVTVDFLLSFQEKDGAIPRTHSDALHLHAYIKPLSPISWLAIAFMVTFVPLIFYGIVFYVNDEFVHELGLGHCYWFMAKLLSYMTLKYCHLPTLTYLTMALYLLWEK